MENPTSLYDVVVSNKIKHGYRRAGLCLAAGESKIEGITENQLAQLQADPRLVVKKAEPASGEKDSKRLSENGKTASTQGKQLPEGVLPADLTVEQLKVKLTELNGMAIKSLIRLPAA
ncbi:HI1506-related protein [[Haemophilus] ducreyi]|uniref:HI1506-related protein n=1 Tax=Haemophilus ducreyi TaxID=730 RepID=UPI000654FE48|nr:HI1506-related protein [[Haemophilus] ducreyi]AKO44808.1 hypothetical protein RZ66_00415 [[Haemophilus] ducreyi]AKO46214.1 hypothetical protein RZ67_00420 [[Haemophilus] ducreyi]AKO47555.1 hypothetical protein RZ68_00415 [[Haemophilus] ducreyi]AKO48938.1 hypothetical protein RZ69_00410 [[Haemophilus] ducreyi]OOS03406.1 hypothetical protein B0190_05755 [[Haemophilus] ducreyi]